MKNKCCQHCTEQFEGCHSVCIKFTAEDLVKIGEYERIRETEKRDRAYNDYRANVWGKKKGR